MLRKEEKVKLKEISLTKEDYLLFQNFVAKEMGLAFSENKKLDLDRAILESFHSSQCSNLQEFFQCLQEKPYGKETEKLISALTVGETYFFRDENQFKALRNRILPEVINRAGSKHSEIKIWSAGCATGEEPYTIAIILKELQPPSNIQVSILGTDINNQSIKKAKKGRYNEWSFRNIPLSLREKYFAKKRDEYEILPELKEMVTFNCLNLNKNFYPAQVNIILCRNVAIYFTKEATQKIIQGFYDCLAEDGWLIMGASDPLIPLDGQFKLEELDGVFIYRKKTKQEEKKTKKARTLLPREKKKEKDVPKEVLQTDNKEIAYSYYSKGKHFANEGDLDKALEWVEKAIKGDKLLYEGYFLLSMIYQGKCENKKAIEALKKAIYINRHFAEGYFCLGTIYKKEKKTELAKRAFRTAVKLLKKELPEKIVPESNRITFGRLLEIAEDNLNNIEA